MDTDPRLKYALDRRFWVPNVRRWTEPVWLDEIIEVILQAKELGHTVFVITINTPRTYQNEGDTGLFIARALTRTEGEAILNFARNDVFYDRDLITGRALLWPDPEMQQNLLAGMVESAYDIIERLSGWHDVDALQEVQDEKRAMAGVETETSNVSVQMDMMISTIFKSIHPLAIRNMDAYQTMELISMVEKILEEQGFKFDMTPPVDRTAELERRRKQFQVKHGDGSVRRQ